MPKSPAMFGALVVALSLTACEGDDGPTDSGPGTDSGPAEPCGNGVLDEGEVCDDGNNGDGDGCSAECHSDETCGNGVHDVAIREACDDGNDVPGDGCEPDCRLSCFRDLECQDGNPCNGAEVCSRELWVCESGPPLAEGTLCAGDMNPNECRAGECIVRRCGDGVVDPSETCDDGNDVAGDGCEPDCTRVCATDADCTDDEPCTGEETCDTTTFTCTLGTAPAEGDECDLDSMPGTRDVCISSVCTASRCGDSFIDVGGGEVCDDGSIVDGDGCDADCTYTPTAYRVIDFDWVDPHPHTDFFGCGDSSSGFNSQLQTNIDMFNTSMVLVFRPLDPTTGTTQVDVYADAMCAAGTPRDNCAPRTRMMTTTANNTTTSGTACFTADSSHLNSSYPAPNGPTGPCFATTVGTVPIDAGGLAIDLTNGVFAAEYDPGTAPTSLLNGVVSGFISETDAQTAMFVAPHFFAGTSLYSHLAAMGATGSACETAVDDRDAVGGVSGFVMHFDFAAELVDWTDP